ncbi:hypothetical protein ABES08_16930 [Peribacillus simplex]|uniref:hypothetical protein n=1 Tax=Peribacillus simplex TaxID=1478 RepID=UPI003D2D8559
MSKSYVWNPTEEFNNLGTDEGLEFLKKLVTYFAEEIDFLSSYNQNITNVDEIRLEKLKSLAYALKVNYKFKENQNLFSDGNSELEEKGLLLQSWISLGAILESTMLLFLSIYNHSYDNNPMLDRKNKKINIEDLKLVKLIEYFFDTHKGIFKGGTIDENEVHIIRLERNLVHLFNNKEVKSWTDFNYCLKIIIELLFELISRLPDVEDENGSVSSGNDDLRRYIYKTKNQLFSFGK